MAKFTTKYDLGQKVWVLHSDTAYRKVNCETCGCNGEVTIGAETFICPKCHGTSQHRQLVGPRWTTWLSGCVGSIKVEVFDPAAAEDYHRDAVDYMLDATGVGSGSVWSERDLFASREEADAECERRNSGRRFADDQLPVVCRSLAAL